MAKFRRIICPICQQPLRPVQKPGAKVVYRCGCRGLERDPGGEDRDIQSGSLGPGPEESDQAP
jgi:hypothetical protein